MYEAIDAGLDEDDVEPPKVRRRRMYSNEFRLADDIGPREQFTLGILPVVLATHRAQREGCRDEAGKHFRW